MNYIQNDFEKTKITVFPTLSFDENVVVFQIKNLRIESLNADPNQPIYLKQSHNKKT